LTIQKDGCIGDASNIAFYSIVCIKKIVTIKTNIMKEENTQQEQYETRDSKTLSKMLPLLDGYSREEVRSLLRRLQDMFDNCRVDTINKK
jgi:hypothetical protein